MVSALKKVDFPVLGFPTIPTSMSSYHFPHFKKTFYRAQNSKIIMRVNVDHSNDAFFSNSISVLHSASNFVLDFKQIMPRVEAMGDKKETMLVSKHNTIVIDPGLAKNLVEILDDMVKKYEKKFGKIKVEKKKIEKDTIKAEVGKDFSYIG